MSRYPDWRVRVESMIKSRAQTRWGPAEFSYRYQTWTMVIAELRDCPGVGAVDVNYHNSSHAHSHQAYDHRGRTLPISFTPPAMRDDLEALLGMYRQRHSFAELQLALGLRQVHNNFVTNPTAENREHFERLLGVFMPEFVPEALYGLDLSVAVLT